MKLSNAEEFQGKKAPRSSKICKFAISLIGIEFARLGLLHLAVEFAQRSGFMLKVTAGGL
ncbi:hypothetical protein FS827_17460 [Agrobacterium vitis]|uniref:hypothetical protein n=1 Tax=Allorhizobium ampelinum TaxID=3025782 RepID=UPI001F3A36AB|nr:hypothetical protein [Allorhizobium ampelinum]MCF1463096.1 hypothetical protein [Allorhizobium ampelinum]